MELLRAWMRHLSQGTVRFAVLSAMPVIFCGAILGGCASTPPAATGARAAVPQHGGTLTIGVAQEPRCLNPILICGTLSTTQLVDAPLFNSWVGIDPQGRWYPLLVTTVPTRANHLVHVANGHMYVDMTIRRNAHWSDGVAITCADFAFTRSVELNPQNLVSTQTGWTQLAAVRCNSPRHIELVFRHPFSAYLADILATFPLPQHALQGKDFNAVWNDGVTVSDGPFKFASWQRGVGVTLVRDPHYWNAGPQRLPYVDAVNYRFASDVDTVKLELRTGQIDFADLGPSTNLDRELAAFPRSSYQQTAGGFWEHLGFNTSVWPTNDVRVRQAIVDAINRPQIVSTTLPGHDAVLNATVPPKSPGYAPAFARDTYRPRQTARLLRAAGYVERDGGWYRHARQLTLTLTTTTGSLLRREIAEMVQQQLASVGIPVSIAAEDGKLLFGQTLVHGQFQIAEWSYSSMPGRSQTSLFACSDIPTAANGFAGNNFYRVCDARLDNALHALDGDLRPARQQRDGALVQQRLAADVALLPLFLRPATVAYANRLHGVVDHPLGEIQQEWNIADWWLSQ